MSTALSTAAPPQTPLPTESLRVPGRTPRTSLVDRVALRVALWLVLWSTRPEQTTPLREDVQNARRLDAERTARETAWLTLARHTHPY